MKKSEFKSIFECHNSDTTERFDLVLVSVLNNIRISMVKDLFLRIENKNVRVTLMSSNPSSSL